MHASLLCTQDIFTCDGLEMRFTRLCYVGRCQIREQQMRFPVMDHEGDEHSLPTDWLTVCEELLQEVSEASNI
jgi:hypothetical protein